MLLEPVARNARAARRASPSAGRRRRRRGSAGGGSGRRRPPGSVAVVGRTSSFRTSPISCAGSTGRPGRAPGPRRCGTPGPRPRRAREPRARRSAAGRAAPRAAPGSSAGRRRRSPCESCTIASISSTNSGLPSAARADPLAQLGVELGRRRAGARSARPSRASSSGSSRTVVAFSLPPPQPGRSSSSSGRARHRSRIGASRDQSATCSTRSRNVGSAQWRSSKTTTSGRSRGGRLEEPPNRQRDLLGRGVARRRAAPRSPRSAAGSSPSSCFTTSTTGQ